MMKKAKRTLALLLAGTLLASCLVGCGANAATPAASTSGGAAASSSTDKAAYNEAGQYIGEPVQANYPLSTEKKTLKIYMRDASNGVVGSWNKIEAFQVAAEKLGVELEFIHPTVGSEADQFNLMIASNEYPDIILWDFTSTPMGLAELVNSGVLVDMDNYIRQYAPNYLALLESREEFQKAAVADNGHYLAIFSFSEGLPISGGPTLRGDMLEKHNLDVPVTVDDWTQVMTALKEKDEAVKYPLTAGKGRDGSVWFDLILPAYKTAQGFCKDEQADNVIYGPADENFKNYLAKLNEWYESGLIDPEFMANDSKNMNAKLADGTCVAGSLQLNYHIANITKTARETNAEFEFEGATWPVLSAGDKPSFPIPGGIYYSGSQIAVTSACEDPALATQMLDYFYSAEGEDLLCWGIEGKSYTTAADGKKTFSDDIMNNKDGKSPQEAILQYAIPTYNFANMIMLEPYSAMVTTLPEQAVARERWLDADSGINLPKLTVAAEEQSDYNMIMNEVGTYVQEMYIKFITGQANLDSDWDSYVNTLNGMGLETATKYMQTAYDAYKAR